MNLLTTYSQKIPDSNQVPGLTFGQGGFGSAQRDYRFLLGNKSLQETGFVMSPTVPVIAPQRFGHRLRVELEFAGEKFKEQLHQPHERDAVGAARARVQPFAEAEKTVEGGIVRSSGFSRFKCFLSA